MILHFCSRDDWESVTDSYRGDTLDTQGFIHCSTAEQVHLPANAIARGRTDLVLLEIDESRLVAPVRWELGDPPDPHGTRFPHLYGPLNTDAVVAVHPFPPDPDGGFTVPAALRRRA